MTMALELWFQADVARILDSTYVTMRSTSRALAGPAGGDGAAAYCAGFGAGLRAVAAAFGLPDPADAGAVVDARCSPWTR